MPRGQRIVERVRFLQIRMPTHDSRLTAYHLPAPLKPAWRRSDPGTRSERRCDATDTPTPHQKLATVGGDYWICAHTGQMVRDQFPEQNPQRYDQWWTNHIGTQDDVTVRRFTQSLAQYEPYHQTGRLYEVGCGEGLLLKAAVELGWQAQGNDISPVAAEHAQRVAGVPVSSGPIESIQVEPGAFDVVLCKDVFEHLQRPRHTIMMLSQAMRPGGLMDLRTLSGQSLSMWLQPTAWVYYSEGHTYVPTLRSLGIYFEAAGLRVIDAKTHGFRTGPRRRDGGRPCWRRCIDKLLSSIVGRIKLGHRVEFLLQKKT